MNTDKTRGKVHSVEAINLASDIKNESNPHQVPDALQPKKKAGIVRGFVWPAFRVLSYGVFLAIVVALILWGLETLAKYGLRRTYLGAVYPDDITMARSDFNRPVSHYDYDFVPGVCLEYNILKGNSYEYANNAGLRDPRDISREKPPDEYRIFLTGGSTAYGLGAIGDAAPAMGWYAIEYRETISHMMEMILNATAPIPGKNIRVYNTAVWGYAYQHNLMRYLAKLRLYNPDLVVSFDGANELPAVSKLTEDWDYFREGQFNNILRDIYAYNRPGLASYLTLWFKNNTFLMTYIWAGRDLFQELNPVVRQHPGVAEDVKAGKKAVSMSVEERSKLLDRNIATVVRIVENYQSALQNDGVPHILALQPWFYLCKKPLHEKEKILAGMTGYREYFGIPSDRVYKLLIDKISESAGNKGYFLVDFSDYFDDVSEWVFTDWCHLTAGANYLVAKELSNLIKEHFFGRPLNEGDSTKNKNEFFWDLAASGSIIYAPLPDAPQNQPKNMLSGYPGEEFYSSRDLTHEERAEVVVDLGEVHPLSRLRLVWGDEDSVPKQWDVEVSTDEKTWHPFVHGSGYKTDNYSRWPGFEYYAAEPVQARYLKYKPLDDSKQVIALRSLSVFR
jgi:hypothetical protein